MAGNKKWRSLFFRWTKWLTLYYSECSHIVYCIQIYIYVISTSKMCILLFAKFRCANIILFLQLPWQNRGSTKTKILRCYSFVFVSVFGWKYAFLIYAFNGVRSLTRFCFHLVLTKWICIIAWIHRCGFLLLHFILPLCRCVFFLCVFLVNYKYDLEIVQIVICWIYFLFLICIHIHSFIYLLTYSVTPFIHELFVMRNSLLIRWINLLFGNKLANRLKFRDS